jgi:CRP/FNR family cyclic AMP-dependent transcriptional regulator
VDVEQTLRQVRLFSELQPKQIKSLAKWTTSRTYNPGQVVVQQGQRGLGLYIIQTGKVKVTQTTDHGEREIRDMGPGEAFGELSLLDNQPRGATITAIEPTTCVLLDKSQFLAEIRTYPEISLHILPILVQWIREADEKIAQLS